MKIEKGLKYLLATVLASMVVMSCAAVAGAEPGDPLEEPDVEQSYDYDTGDPDGTESLPSETWEQSSDYEDNDDDNGDPDDQGSVPVAPGFYGEGSDETDDEPQQKDDQDDDQDDDNDGDDNGYDDDNDDDGDNYGSRYVVEESHTYVYDENNDYYEYNYPDEYDGVSETNYYEESETSEDEPEEPERDTSSLDISDYELSDTKVLTPQDWEDLKKNAQGEISSFELKPTPTNANTPDGFKKLKEDSVGGNDDWVYLVWGIVLISLGVIGIGAVIFTTVVSKRKLRR